MVLALGAGPIQAQSVRTDLPLTNGMVNALLFSGGKLYLGGNFTNIGPATGAGVPVDTTSAQVIAGFPTVAGTINAVAPDGDGGWFIGGAFTSVGGQGRLNLAHLRADLSVADWNPAADQAVFALAVRNGVVYAGGSFLNVGGAARAAIAALDSSSGNALSWNPGADGTVRAFALTDSVIYAGGSFLNIGGASRGRIAALDLASGNATAWNPGANGSVFALSTSAGTVYAGGFFSSIGGQSRVDLAALDAATGLATSWNPAPDNQVLTLAVSGNLVYAGGAFTKFGGVVSRSRVAALDATTGAPASWNPNANGRVLALAALGSVVYAGGEFTLMGGQPRTFVAALDSASGSPTTWNPSAYGPVLALAPGAPGLYVAGSFNGIGGTHRRSLAAVDLTSGAITGWDPEADAPVLALAGGNGMIFAGGSFNNVGGQARGAVAALDTLGGAATSWNPGVDNMVSALAVSGGSLYVGGTFATLGGQSRNNLGAVDLASGLPTGWNPNVDGQVSTIAPSNGLVYFGGSFNNVNGQTRHNLAVVDSATGAALAWNPNANGTVRALIPTCGRVYAAGFFTTIGGQTRNRVALLDATSATAGSWNPNANGPVFAATLVNGALYASGLFSTIGGQTRLRLASLDPASGTATAWNPGADNLVQAFASDASNLYAGGSFATLGQTSVSGLAGIQLDGSLSCPALAFSPTFLPSASTGNAYSQSVNVSGGAGPFCFALTAGSLPPGVLFNAGTGEISGTPSVAGNYGFTLAATTGAACVSTHDYVLSVSRTCPPITLAPATLPPARVGVAYTDTLSASGAVAPLSFGVSSGTLPNGFSLSPDGIVSGTATLAGASTFTIAVTDSFLCQGARSYTLTVFPPCNAIAIGPQFPLLGAVGSPYDQTFTASGGTSSYTWSLASGSLPGGLVLDAATGRVHGTPAVADTFPVALAATDSTGCVGTRSYVLTIFSSPPVSSVAANAGGLLISNGRPCVSVPIQYTRGESTPVRSIHLTLTFDATRLAFCAPGTAASAIHPGSWLNGHPDSTFAVTDNGDGTYDVDLAVPGEACGVDSGGTLATIDLSAAGPDSSGTISVLAVQARDCAGALVAVQPGSPATLGINRQPLVVQPPSLPGGAVGIAYAATLSTDQGTAPFAWTVTSGSLPAGLTLNAGSGVLSGTPLASGSSYFGVTAMDVNGRTGTRSYSVAIFDTPPASLVAAQTAGLCITASQPLRTVPFVYERVDSVAARAVSVSFQIDTSKVALATPGNSSASVHRGSWLSGTTNAFFVTDNGGGVYTVDLSVLGTTPCGLTTGGEVFTVDLVGHADGEATIAVLTVRSRDCSNNPIPVAAGPASLLAVDRNGPSAIASLTAQIETVIGSSDSTTRVLLNWTPGSAGQVDLYRAPHGTYPLYADASPAPDTTLVPGGPWVLIATDPSPGYADSPPGRGVWDYVATTTDSCGVRVLSNTARGALDYLLGDVSNGLAPGTGDDRVQTADISLLGSHYGVVGEASDAVGYLDVGPTLSGLPDSPPVPDHQIDFEDLVIFSINYGTVASPPESRPSLARASAVKATRGKAAASAIADRFTVSGPSHVEAGTEFTDTLSIVSGGGTHAFSARLAWDAAVVEPIATQSLGFIEAQRGIVLSARPGTVDAALLGTASSGISGQGDVATVRFRALRSGAPGIAVAGVDARDLANQPILQATTAATPAPTRTLLLAPAPNPAPGAATVSYALARAGAVRLFVYDIAGRRVRTLVSGVKEAGAYRTSWNGRDEGGRGVAAGVYYVVLDADGVHMTERLVLLR